MEVFRSNRKSISNDVTVVSTLPLYRSAPPLEVRLEDFELFAMDRLRGTVFFSATILKALIGQEKRSSYEHFFSVNVNIFQSLIWYWRNDTNKEE